jgi:hypothetical protein
MGHWRELQTAAGVLALSACGEEARISASADLPPPLAVAMLTVSVQDDQRVISWSGTDFQSRPSNPSPTTPEVNIKTAGPDLGVTHRLESDGVLLSTGSVTLPRKSDWRWHVSIQVATANPLEVCFGCEGAQAFALVEEFRVSEQDSVWVVWGGNSISEPVIY